MAAPYGPESLEVLEGLEPVRRRPGMYFGGTGAERMHRLLWEVLGNAVDEMLRVGGGRIAVTCDGRSVTVDDDGAGIPLEAIERVMTRLHAGTAAGARRHVHLVTGMRGVGVAPVNAVCEAMQVEVWRDGVHCEQRYVRGAPEGPVAQRGPATRTGTRVTLTPDREVFGDTAWDPRLIDRRCREIAALTPSVTMVVDGAEHRYGEGLARFVEELAGVPLVDPLVVRASEGGVEVDLALAWSPGRGVVRGFVNYCEAAKGTHIDGLRGGVRRAVVKRVPAVARRRTGKAHLVAVIHVQLVDPRFGQPSREWLVTPEVAAIVAGLVERALLAHFERGPMLDALILG